MALTFNQDTLEKFGLKVKNKNDLIALINDLKRKPARTTKDKYEILETRDNILKFSK